MPQHHSGASKKNAAKTGTRTTSLAKNAGGAKPSQEPSGSKHSADAPEAGLALQAGLYIVATPIGNLGDITLRALGILRGAAVILCEDTRVTAKLLARHAIATPLLQYHDHNAERMRPVVLERLRRGDAIALVSDAGTPLVSDPGFKLARAAMAEGMRVTALPGPSAVVTALVLSGLPSDRFFFGGFLPVKDAARRRVLVELAALRATLIFFETAPRLAASLAAMAAVFGNRPAAVARELTKLFEETRRGTLSELAAHYRDAGPPKGEIVLVIAPPAEEGEVLGAEALDRQLEAALQQMSLKDASSAVAAASGLPRREVYNRALRLQRRAP